METLPDLEDIASTCNSNLNAHKSIRSTKTSEIDGIRKGYRLKDVIKNGLCMGCGLCVSIANSYDSNKNKNTKFLEMKVVPPGRYRPVFLQHEKNKTDGILHPIIPNEELILKVCPGINVNHTDNNEIDGKSCRPKSQDKVMRSATTYSKEEKELEHPSVNGYVQETSSFMGPILSVRKCFASDPEVRFRSAAAGGLTALSEYLLESKEVDFIHHIRADKPNLPMMSVVQKSKTKDDLLEGSQSRYGPAAPLENILQVLNEKQPFCFIGKPCDINGLANLAKYYPDVNKYVRFKLTISCGMIPDQSMYLEWLAEQRMRKEDLVDFRYRGCGCPGASPYARTEVKQKGTTSAVSKSNIKENKKIFNEAKCDYRDFFYGRKWSCQLRCKVCPDFLGEQADITVMDCWHKGLPEGEGPGFVLILGRTAKGEKLLQDCLKEERYLTEVKVINNETWDDLDKDNFVISLDGSFKENETNKVSYKDIIRTQPHQMTRKIANYSRQMAIKESNVIIRLDSTEKEYIVKREFIDDFLPKAICADSSLSIMLRHAIKNVRIVENIKPGALCFKDTEKLTDMKSAEDVQKEKEQKHVLFGEVRKNFNLNENEISPFLQEYMRKNYEGAKKRIQDGAES